MSTRLRYAILPCQFECFTQSQRDGIVSIAMSARFEELHLGVFGTIFGLGRSRQQLLDGLSEVTEYNIKVQLLNALQPTNKKKLLTSTTLKTEL